MSILTYDTKTGYVYNSQGNPSIEAIAKELLENIACRIDGNSDKLTLLKGVSALQTKTKHYGGHLFKVQLKSTVGQKVSKVYIIKQIKSYSTCVECEKLAITKLANKENLLTPLASVEIENKSKSNKKDLLMIFEFAQGSLDNVTTSDLHDFIHIITGLANGLANIHEQKLIHNDLKLANCFLRNDGTGAVGDFGTLTIDGTFNGDDLKDEFFKTGRGRTYVIINNYLQLGEYDLKSAYFNEACRLITTYRTNPPDRRQPFPNDITNQDVRDYLQFMQSYTNSMTEVYLFGKMVKQFAEKCSITIPETVLTYINETICGHVPQERPTMSTVKIFLQNQLDALKDEARRKKEEKAKRQKEEERKEEEEKPKRQKEDEAKDKKHTLKTNHSSSSSSPSSSTSSQTTSVGLLLITLMAAMAIKKMQSKTSTVKQ